MKDIKIVVATHKPYRMPEDAMYFPLQVGKANHPDVDLGFACDDMGDNISAGNDRFNELTAIYWAWKNLKGDYIGLAHYRRHFQGKRWGDKWERVLDREQAEALLRKTDVIVPRRRRYYIETMRSHYEHSPHTVNADIELMGIIIRERQPAYAPAFSQVMNGMSAHMCNMFIMKRELFDQYCAFLFDVMLEFDRRVDLTGRRPIQKRFFISEFMLDVWLRTNGVKYRELPLVYFESQYWPRRIKMLILRRLGLKRS